jgi:hypothetical protein
MPPYHRKRHPPTSRAARVLEQPISNDLVSHWWHPTLGLRLSMFVRLHRHDEPTTGLSRAAEADGAAVAFAYRNHTPVSWKFRRSFECHDVGLVGYTSDTQILIRAGSNDAQQYTEATIGALAIEGQPTDNTVSATIAFVAPEEQAQKLDPAGLSVNLYENPKPTDCPCCPR